jgi:hypothetical protein
MTQATTILRPQVGSAQRRALQSMQGDGYRVRYLGSNAYRVDDDAAKLVRLHSPLAPRRAAA